MKKIKKKLKAKKEVKAEGVVLLSNPSLTQIRQWASTTGQSRRSNYSKLAKLLFQLHSSSRLTVIVDSMNHIRDVFRVDVITFYFSHSTFVSFINN